ncbi:MAG: phosphoenolpyruvate carboxylase [Muricauda sp.]|jgi:phosphoenolpyruvate carboxylase|nr:phosphoenolpyruvate carboxylase [Allomuricauda sp.]MBO6589379.1 phosphoenolpyruvate carboxylase [Allomuricauda sp.]MBO6619189.1 phosphoenolpyruvate carboxylase [Allomuricauda sp.]MBO6644916.1 phosphoenolpyruvate carboxylase [Allomuricauda sp.]MBO6747309.1 phosphoenolpyruvate carboxylase [Allomuricauda sp.]MBO6845123.1 phosphoenolpyruvate carboxylase [Allomuricauda sp.]
MQQTKRLEEFKKSVTNKFNIYNSLFLSLPYKNVENVGNLVPLLLDQCEKGLKEGKDPQEILEVFFSNFVNIQDERERLDFMFRMIQYVERQVVLYDSVEDSAFPKLQKYSSSLTIKDYFELVNRTKNWDKVSKKLSTFSARIVLTAHPTQFYTPAILDIIAELRSLIDQDRIYDIDVTLQQLGLTSLINAKKPTPLDEAKNIIYILRHTYYDAVGELYQYVKSNIRDDKFENYNLMKLGFWPGGDRDGNPYVTADITKQVADELRLTLMKCYYNELKGLRKKLTFKGMQEDLNDLSSKLYNAMFNVDAAISYSEIIGYLEKIREKLRSDYHDLYLDELNQLMDKVHIFKTHFATLDIRQDHSKHLLVVESVLKKEGVIKESINEIKEQELVKLLLEKSFQLNPKDFEDDIVKDTIVNIKNLKSIQEKNGEDGCNRYIISNSEDIFSVLFVFGLFRWCGWDEKEITFDIVPLFETMKGMDASEEVMQTLFDIPQYRQHLERRRDIHTIMLGFSDGTKDGGYLKANWSILKTKETLSKVCKKNGVAAIFFDGRGGPPARGGGKTHRFYAAQTKDVANHEIQLTIQGQTITSTYGTKEQFIHNSEQLLTAGLSNNLFGKELTISAAQRKLIEELSELSFEKYDALKQHEKFMPYLEHRSTLKYYTKANIGSRPGKRGNKKQLTLSDLRAISFVGSWSQLKQNVPGYFGLGTAISALKEQGRLSEVKKLYKEVPFFRALMHNSMMSLAKSNFNLTGYMKEDPEFGDFWNILHDEFQLSKKMLLQISGDKMLMEDEAVSRESVKIREKIVLPLLVIQQNALYHITQNSEYKELYEKIVTRSLYGNINASRNSA